MSHPSGTTAQRHPRAQRNIGPLHSDAGTDPPPSRCRPVLLARRCGESVDQGPAGRERSVTPRSNVHHDEQVPQSIPLLGPASASRGIVPYDPDRVTSKASMMPKYQAVSLLVADLFLVSLTSTFG